MTQPPVSRLPSNPGAPQLIQRVLDEPTGVAGAAVTTILCIALSLALWVPLAWPSTAIGGAIPPVDCKSAPAGVAATACAVGAVARPLAAPLLLAVIAFVFRKALTALVEAARRRIPMLSASFAALLATVVFVLSWAGSHLGRPMEFGILPQIVFPGLVGLCTYATARWGPPLHRVLRLYFDLRDGLPMKLRLVLMMALPTLLSFWLASGTGPGRVALNEQIVVVTGILAGFFILAPRGKPKGPIQ